MKKILLITALVFIAFKLNAQEIEYDTMIYYPPAVTCQMWMDSAGLYDPSGTSAEYHIFTHYTLLKILCGYDIPIILDNMVIGAQDTLVRKIKAFAQPYHLDTAVYVIGVATRMKGQPPGMITYYNYFHLLDSTIELDRVPLPRQNGPYPLECTLPYWQCPKELYYFQNRHLLKDFYLAVDFTPIILGTGWGSSTYRFDHTVSFSTEDTSCLKIDRGCYQDEPPYLFENNQWTRFDNDPIYWYYRKMHIGWYPIILVPKNSLTDIDLDNTITVFPNPASDILVLRSQFKINRVDIYNILGLKVREEEINQYETTLNIDYLPVGTYILNITTPRGVLKRKIIKQ